MRMLEPSKEEKAWRQFADEIGAESEKGFFAGIYRVSAYVNPWTIVFEDSRNMYGPDTTVTAYYRAKDKFWFKVYRRDWFNRLAKRLGAKHIEVGLADFDRDFVVLANDELKVRSLLANPELLHYIQAVWSHGWTKHAEDYRIKDTAEGSCLYMTIPLTPDSAGQLKSILELFVETLNQLVDIGAAESPPRPDL